MRWVEKAVEDLEGLRGQDLSTFSPSPQPTHAVVVVGVERHDCKHLVVVTKGGDELDCIAATSDDRKQAHFASDMLCRDV